MIHHVLAAISTTPHGHTVAHESHALARQLGARLTLLHVLPDHVPPFARLLWGDLERTQREAYLSAAWFMDEVRRDLRDPAVQQLIVPAMGDLAERIAGVAREQDAQLIAVGTDAQPRLQPGVGQRLLRCARWPVVLIGPAQGTPTPLAAPHTPPRQAARAAPPLVEA